MPLNPETKIDLLKTAVIEDRTEIRLIKDRIDTLCTFMTVSSFAISAFLLSPKNDIFIYPRPGFFLLIDLSFIVLLWAVFVSLKRNLNTARVCLEEREEMIRELGKAKKEKGEKDFDPFPYVKGKTPRMKEGASLLTIGIATAVIVVKLIFVLISIKTPNV